MRPPMSRWTISNTESGITLGVFEAASEAEALDVWARDAGYTCYAEAIAIVPVARGEIVCVECNPDWGTTKF